MFDPLSTCLLVCVSSLVPLPLLGFLYIMFLLKCWKRKGMTKKIFFIHFFLVAFLSISKIF